jgi:hypothetical protein
MLPTHALQFTWTTPWVDNSPMSSVDFIESVMLWLNVHDSLTLWTFNRFHHSPYSINSITIIHYSLWDLDGNVEFSGYDGDRHGDRGVSVAVTVQLAIR